MTWNGRVLLPSLGLLSRAEGRAGPSARRISTRKRPQDAGCRGVAPGSASSPWHWAGQLLPGEWCLGRGSTPPPQLGRHTAESRSAQEQGRLRAANIRTTGCSLPPACLRLQPRRRAEVLRSREQGLESRGLSAGTWVRLLLLEDRWGPRAEAQGPSDSGGGCLLSARGQGPGAHPGKSTWPKCRRAPLTHRPTTAVSGGCR